MSISTWIGPVLIVLVTWGLVGVLQKLCTNYISAESALVWWFVGSLLLLPWLLPDQPVLSYSTKAITWALISGFFNALGCLVLLAAMKSGGKASIVATAAALYPLPVAIVTPLIFHESVTAVQAAGVVCALIGIVLLSAESA